MKNKLLLVILCFVLLNKVGAVDINASRQITIVVTPTDIGIGSNGMITHWVNSSQYSTYNFPDSWNIIRNDLYYANETPYTSYNLTTMKADIVGDLKDAINGKNITMTEDFKRNISSSIQNEVGSSVSNSVSQIQTNIINTLSDSINTRCNNIELQNNIINGIKGEITNKDDEIKNVTTLYNSLLVQNTALQRDYAALQQEHTQVVDESNKKNFFIIGLSAIILVAIFAYWSGGNLDLSGLNKFAWKKGPTEAISTAKYPYKPTTNQIKQEMRPPQSLPPPPQDGFPDFNNMN